MKKLFVILGVFCTLALGSGVYSYAYVPERCSSVSGADVSTYEKSLEFCVMLTNNSGSRCSASFKVYGKLENGSWEYAGSGILSADNGGSDAQCFDRRGYSRMRVDEISTWKCN